MSSDYEQKKAFFDRMLTIYGRKPVLEALQDRSIELHKIHLADSNKTAGIVDEIIKAAQARGIEIQYHSKQALSRISKNAKQDQGVAADIVSQLFAKTAEFIEHIESHCQRAHPKLLALDGLTNPQNVGMIARTAAAAGIDGLIVPRKGCADLGPLVIKASVGTIFKIPVLKCDSLEHTLPDFIQRNYSLNTLAADAKTSLFDHKLEQAEIFVLGNETDGVSKQVDKLCQQRLMIPMNNGVESLNVAVTAALIAYHCELS
jgi:23S rRNA (guanosine2251-2'-O)-methyltransferase